MLYVILCALLLGAAAGRRSPGLDATHASEQRHPRLTQDTIPLPIDSLDFTVAGVAFGATSGFVRRRLGVPDSSRQIRDGGQAWHYGDLTVLFRQVEVALSVQGFVIRGPRFMTARGLRVGDTRERVQQLYGNPIRPDSFDVEFQDPTRAGRAVLITFDRRNVLRIYVGLLSN